MAPDHSLHADQIMRRILVTGGAGFLGSFLCEHLLAEGHQVFCLDNFFTGRTENVAHLTENFDVIRHDVVEPYYLEVDEIYHLACPASPVHYQHNPVRTLKTAVMGTLNMLELAQQTGARILITSTSEIYGDPEVHPQREDYWGHVNPIGKRSCYDEGKRCAEALATAFTNQHRVDVRIVRIFNTYGPRMNEADGRVISNFITQALRKEPLTIYGDGSQTRSLCYQSDLVRGLVALMGLDHDPGPVNLGNPQEMSIRQIAELIIELTGSSSTLAFEPLPSDDPTRRRPDIGKAKRLLGWEPTVPAREGLAKVIEYFRERMPKPNGHRRNPARAASAQVIPLK